MHYHLYGLGTPVLLLHGGASDIERSFSKQLGYFAQDHLVIAPEQAGHGLTRDPDRPLSYVEMADATAALLDYLKIPAVDVIGWSDGGIVGLLLAIRHPAVVRHLAVTGASFLPVAESLREDVLLALRDYVPSQDSDWRAIYAQTSGDPPHHFEAFATKVYDLWSNHPAAGELDSTMLASIRVPTLVIAGDNDIIRLDHTLALYHAIPQAALFIVPGSGHRTLQTRPEWLNPIIRDFFNHDTTQH
jgi:pimeloyl-ACP methyl ester carboxylesterase